MSFHTAFELRKNKAVIWIRSEAQRPTVQHKLFKLCGQIKAELVDGDLLLFSLDVVIFLIL